MSQSSQNISTSAAAEPQAGSASMPVWLLMALLMVFLIGGVLFDANGGWFSPQVYAPYHNFEEVQLFQPVTTDDWKRVGQFQFERADCHPHA